MKQFISYLLLPLIGLFLFNRIQETITYRHKVVRAMQSIEDVYISLLNAETGQRGYLLTERESYLEPFVFAELSVQPSLDEAKSGALGELELEKIKIIEKHALAKMAELRQSIDVCRANGSKAAVVLVNNNEGKKEMDEIRVLIEIIRDDQLSIWARTADDLRDLLNGARISMLIVAMLSSLQLGTYIWAKNRPSPAMAAETAVSEV